MTDLAHLESIISDRDRNVGESAQVPTCPTCGGMKDEPLYLGQGSPQWDGDQYCTDPFHGTGKEADDDRT